MSAPTAPRPPWPGWKPTSAKATCPPILRCGRSWKTWPWTPCWTKQAPPAAPCSEPPPLFGMPVPEPVIGVLAGQVGGSADRLRGLGLLDPYPDIYDPARTALAASPLAAGRIDPLSASEQAAVAALTAGPLFAAWGGATPQRFREGVLDVQLARLALAADDPAITAACAPGAVASLRSGPAAGRVPARPGRDQPARPPRPGRRRSTCCGKPPEPRSLAATARRARHFWTGRCGKPAPAVEEGSRPARPGPGHRRTCPPPDYPRRTRAGRTGTSGRPRAVHRRRIRIRGGGGDGDDR